MTMKAGIDEIAAKQLYKCFSVIPLTLLQSLSYENGNHS